MALTEIDDEIDVFLHIAEHLLAPFLAVAERGNGGNGSKNRGLVELVGRQPFVEGATQGLIGHDGIGTDHSGDIERFRGSTESDAAGSSFLAH